MKNSNSLTVKSLAAEIKDNHPSLFAVLKECRDSDPNFCKENLFKSVIDELQKEKSFVSVYIVTSEKSFEWDYLTELILEKIDSDVYKKIKSKIRSGILFDSFFKKEDQGPMHEMTRFRQTANNLTGEHFFLFFDMIDKNFVIFFDEIKPGEIVLNEMKQAEILEIHNNTDNISFVFGLKNFLESDLTTTFRRLNPYWRCLKCSCER